MNSRKKPDKRKLEQKIAFLFFVSNQWEDEMEGKVSIHNKFTKTNGLALDFLSVFSFHEEMQTRQKPIGEHSPRWSEISFLEEKTQCGKCSNILLISKIICTFNLCLIKILRRVFFFLTDIIYLSGTKNRWKWVRKFWRRLACKIPKCITDLSFSEGYSTGTGISWQI